MILGIGVDICDLRRIERSITRFGDRFLNRVFSEEERRACDQRAAPAACYARRWAAKEACVKALGSGVADGVGLRDIRVFSDQWGKPGLTLHGGAAARLAAATPTDATARLHLSLSDEPPFAQAFVVIEAV